MTPQQMAAHIAKICKIEDIEVDSHSRGGRAYRKSSRIKIRPVKSAITYAVALHEIGHILGPRQSGTRLYQEVGAWEYAMSKAVEWTPAMNATMCKALQSYINWANRSKQAKKPEPDHPIFALTNTHCMEAAE